MCEEGVFGVEQRGGFGVDLARGAEDGGVDGSWVDCVFGVWGEEEEEGVYLEAEFDGEVEEVAGRWS